MKVFLPFKEIKNKFIYEIGKDPSLDFTYGAFSDYDESYDIVNIHWPEALFSWKEPSDKQLIELSELLMYWNQFSIVVSVVHNDFPHYKNSENFRKLYKLVLSNSKGIIHLEKYSFNKYKEIYRKAKHQIIYHPLYKCLPNNFNIDKEQARKKLGLSLDAKIFLVFGTFRHSEEENLMLDIFKKIKIKNKLLLVPRMSFLFLNDKKNYQRKLSKLYYLLNNVFQFKNTFLTETETELYLKACDVLWVVRKESLNSGNVFLGWNYKRVVIGPNIGNINESIKKSGMFTYSPNNIEEAAKIVEKSLHVDYGSLKLDYIEKHRPDLISKKYSSFFKSLLKI